MTLARAHTLAPSILPLLEAMAECFFWNLPEFGPRIRFDGLHGYETCPLDAHFQNSELPEVTRSGIENTVVGWRKKIFSRRGIAAQQAMYSSVRYRDAETTVPATCSAASSDLQNLHVEIDQ
jgi:hypothetical protein